MKVIKAIYESKLIKGLKKIELDTFTDFRGEIWTTYSKEFTDVEFVMDKITISKFGVLRGFHGDADTTKLISCLGGQLQFAVVDLRKESETYHHAEHFYINDKVPTVFEVPAGCINAHLCLSDSCIFYYKWSKEYRGPDSQVTINWNDKDINIPWMLEKPILSDRDKGGTSLEGVHL